MPTPVAIETFKKSIGFSAVVCIIGSCFWLATLFVDIITVKPRLFYGIHTVAPIIFTAFGIQLRFMNKIVDNSRFTNIQIDAVASSIAWLISLLSLIVINILYCIETIKASAYHAYYETCIWIYFLIMLNEVYMWLLLVRVAENGIASRENIESFLDVDGRNDMYYESDDV